MFSRKQEENIKKDKQITEEVRKLMMYGERFEKFYEGTDTMKKINEFIEIEHKKGKSDLDIISDMFTSKGGKSMIKKNNQFNFEDFKNMNVPKHIVEACNDNLKVKLKGKENLKDFEDLFEGIIDQKLYDTPQPVLSSQSPQEGNEENINESAEKK